MRNLLIVALTLVAAPVAAQTISLKGPAGQSVKIGAADLAALPRAKFVFDAHGQKHEYEGPLLIDILAKAGAPTGRDLRGANLAHAVLVTSSDGYQVVYGLAELDPGTRANRVILADREDGKPMAGNDGPFKVVAEGDVRPARSARMVTDIEVVRLGTASGGGAPHDH